MSVPVGLSSKWIALERAPRPRYVGIYFLVKDERIVYVGKSIDIEQRMGEHKAARQHRVENYRKDWDSAFWVPVSVDKLDMYEGAFIRLLAPLYNMRPSRNQDGIAIVAEEFSLSGPDLVHAAELAERRYHAYTLPQIESHEQRRKWRKARERKARKRVRSFINAAEGVAVV